MHLHTRGLLFISQTYAKVTLTMNYTVKYIPDEPEIIGKLKTVDNKLEPIKEYAVIETNSSHITTIVSNKSEAYNICEKLNKLSHRRYSVFNSREPSLYKDDKFWTLIDSIQNIHKNFNGSIHEAIVEAGYLNNAIIKDRYP